MSTYRNDSNLETAQVRGWIGRTAYDVNGDKVGKVEDVYEDHEGSGPEWFAISTGWFSTKRSLAPVNGSTADGDRLILPWTKDQIKNAPNFDSDDELDFDNPDRLYGHYNMAWGDTRTSVADRDRDRDRGDDAMTRSEEEIDVSTRSREAGRVRLHKWIETEQKQVTVPVRREVARMVTEPITGNNIDRAMDGPDMTESEHDVVLHEDEVVVEKRVVPKERVRLETDTVEDERKVDETVRKERVAMDTDADVRDKRR